ncbi:hypothetical protein [Macrococcus brunensis]|uniref:hypothetical protein n=1 Tax=Macrococcus brunensis TaxID=198483 RepID=UPI001EF0BB5D|nr:hypothetical protein [Macrococcus brunensis]ULG72206.1 hypothetical protein MGG12_01375 [Macrococcus brunensis]
MTKKEMKTMTYGAMPLKIETKQGLFFNDGVEVKAVLNTETGEVTFKISEEDLERIKMQEKEG